MHVCCCSAVAATPDMKTLIAAGSDKKIKEMEDNSVCLARFLSAYEPCTMQSSSSFLQSALLSALLLYEAYALVHGSRLMARLLHVWWLRRPVWWHLTWLMCTIVLLYLPGCGHTGQQGAGHTGADHSPGTATRRQDPLCSNRVWSGALLQVPSDR
jgi:hypothetical protein